MAALDEGVVEEMCRCRRQAARWIFDSDQRYRGCLRRLWQPKLLTLDGGIFCWSVREKVEVEDRIADVGSSTVVG